MQPAKAVLVGHSRHAEADVLVEYTFHDASTFVGSRAWEVPIYFALGNHDFYGGSIAGVRSEIQRLVPRVPGLMYLGSAEPIPLFANTVLLGADCWGDGRCGDTVGSSIQINDLALIKDLRWHLSRRGRCSWLATGKVSAGVY